MELFIGNSNEKVLELQILRLFEPRQQPKPPLLIQNEPSTLLLDKLHSDINTTSYLNQPVKIPIKIKPESPPKETYQQQNLELIKELYSFIKTSEEYSKLAKFFYEECLVGGVESPLSRDEWVYKEFMNNPKYWDILEYCSTDPESFKAHLLHQIFASLVRSSQAYWDLSIKIPTKKVNKESPEYRTTKIIMKIIVNLYIPKPKILFFMILINNISYKIHAFELGELMKHFFDYILSRVSLEEGNEDKGLEVLMKQIILIVRKNIEVLTKDESFIYIY